MRNALIVAALAVAAVLALSSLAAAAPSLGITKPPVQPIPSYTGPPGDPHSTWGQWFRDKRTGLEQWRTHEFHDNYQGSGGGGAGTAAIKGVAVNIVYLGGPGTAIQSFDINATVSNDTPGSGGYLAGSNSHGETRQAEGYYTGSLYNVKLTASFAVDQTVSLPAKWVAPYRNRTPYIVAQNNDQLAWYCWTPGNPDGKQPDGGYFVPTWDFGTIQQGQSVTKTLKFAIPGGLQPTDSRYNPIVQSAASGSDLLLNRTKSLKLSDWIDELRLDGGQPNPPEPPLKNSDVSVFHQYYPEPRSRDWGDAPDPSYPTKAVNDGANHFITFGFNLGPQGDIDSEADGQPDANATGDDLNNVADETGVMWLTPLVPGQPAQVQVFLTNTAGIANAFLDAWIDFNGDGSWLTPGDQIAMAAPLLPGPNVVNFNVPAGVGGGMVTFARFRLSSVGNLPPTGMAIDGEVEDHSCFIEQPHPEETDFGDAPDPTYPTLSASGGASHKIVTGNPTLTIGALVDSEPDGQPDPNAKGDDNNGIDDEEGVSWGGPLMVGASQTVTVTCAVPAGAAAYLNAWIDFGIDGGWAEAGDQIITDAVVGNGPNTFSFTVPASAGSGTTFARFRLSTQPGLGYGGAAQDGEVEDEEVVIEAMKDFGDAPDSATALGYPTLRINNGAWHKLVLGLHLGASIDQEVDGQPDATATGDDLAGIVPDDEDGVTIGQLIPGANATITVVATVTTGNAFLDGWIDWNANNSWADAGDQVFAAQPVANGNNVFTIPVPAGLGVGTVTYARFRISSNSAGLPFTGGWSDGEVEDYQVKIGYKWVQNPDLTRTGIDVKASYPNILADDFPCTVAGPITDVHIWGSWKYDEIQDPTQVRFILSFHEDIPAGSGSIPYSRPGAVLWWRLFEPGQFGARPYAYVEEGEGWWDPVDPLSYIFPGDHMVWQYDFLFEQEPFHQTGSEEHPKVYWLDVQAIPEGAAFAEFGWKTRTLDEPHFMDDAVWGQGTEPFFGPWKELRYPRGHPKQGESIDMAFALTGYAEPRDWGDAPDPTYPTLSSSAGANHRIVQGFCLGNLIDSEGDGQPNANATGDDLANLPDEDGVIWAPLTPGQLATIQVFLTDTVGYPAFLDAWIDFNANGGWADAGEQIAAALPLAAGPNAVTFAVPRTWNPNPITTFSRFRLTSYGGVPYFGICSDGEVEDHACRIGPDRGTLSFSVFKTIPDHFWWRSDPDPYNEMLSLKVGADAVEAIDWNSITLTLAGGAPGDVAQIDVWLDNNANGVVDVPGDTSIGLAISPGSPVTIALGPAAVTTIPAGGSVFALISYKLAPTAAIGNVYSFQATGATGTGAVSGLPAYVTGLPISSCRKIVAPKPITIGEAKLQPVGSTVYLRGKEVTAVFGTPPSGGAPWNLFYIEEKDRSAGIGVQYAAMIAPVSQGNTVQLLGNTLLVNGTELVMNYIHLIVGPSLMPYIAPVGMNNKWTGGGAFGGQPAVYDQALPLPGAQSTGLSNVGSLVRTWGLVTYHDWSFMTPAVSGPIFWIDDGSDLHDGFWMPLGGRTEGVACFYGFCGHPGSFPDIGEYWGVTGIMRAIPNTNLIPQAVRLLVPRAFPADLNQFSP